LAALVVAFGPTGPLSRCLASLDPGATVVVDNGGSSDCRAVVEKYRARYVPASSNRGFAAGVNLGIAHVPGQPDVLLVNPDAVLPWAEAKRLHAALRSAPDLAAVAPRLRHPDGATEQVAWAQPTPRYTAWDALGRGPVWLAAHPDQAFLSGAVLLLRREALRDVGPFDERFFLYAEEADWQRRAVRRGWTVKVVEDVVAEHVGGGSSEDDVARATRVTRGALDYSRKWDGVAGRWAFRGAAIAAASRRWLLGDAQTRLRERARLGVLLGRDAVRA